MAKDKHPLEPKQPTIAALAVWSLRHGLWRYTPADLATIGEAAPRPLTAEEIDSLERVATAYCEKLPVLTKVQADTIRELSRKLAGELNSLSTITLPGIERRVHCVREVQTWARSHVEQRRGNRARPTLDGYIRDVVMFYVKTFSADAGRAPDSPCARFVRATISPVVIAIGGEMKSIEKVIRSRKWLRIADDYADAVESPVLGRPKLTVNRPSD
jgi:hypothetical protein